MLTDSDCTRGEDLIMCVTIEVLCCMLETNVRLYINYSSIKKNRRKKKAWTSDETT